MDFIFATGSIKRILYLILLVGINFVIYHNPNDIYRYWAVWSAFFLSLIIWDETLTLRLKMILQSGLAFITAVFVFGSVGRLPLLPFVLCFFTLCAVIFSEKYPQYFLSTLIVILFAIIAGLSFSSFIDTEREIMWIGIGTLVVFFCHLLFYLRPIKKTFYMHTYLSLRHLLGLNQAIFATLIDPHYKALDRAIESHHEENLYSFEKWIYVSKNKYIQSQLSFRKLLSMRDKKDFYMKFAHLLDKLNLLYDSLLDLSMLRFRIKDKTVLKVCEVELIGIREASNQVIKGFMKKFSSTFLRPKVNDKENIDQLLKWIFKFEENYQHFLEALAENPLAFLLFVDSLKSLAHQMKEIAEDNNRV